MAGLQQRQEQRLHLLERFGTEDSGQKVSRSENFRVRGCWILDKSDQTIRNGGYGLDYSDSEVCIRRAFGQRRLGSEKFGIKGFPG